MLAADRLAARGPALAGSSMLRHHQVPAPASPVPSTLGWRGSRFPGEAGGLSCFGQVYVEICFLNEAFMAPETFFFFIQWYILPQNLFTV